MLILGIDPGLERLGWGFISDAGSKLELVDAGCFQTSKQDTEPERLRQIYEFLRKTIKKRHPDIVSIEQLFFATNAKTALTVSQARGVILLAAQITKTPIATYTPLQVKQALTGYGKADKRQVQLMVKSILKLPTIPQPDDTADALAIAIAHQFSYRSTARLNHKE